MNTNRVQRIQEDIDKINNTITDNKLPINEVGELVSEIVYAYRGDIDQITAGLQRYSMYGDKQYYNDLKKLKVKLEHYLAKLKDEKVNGSDPHKNTISIVNTNNNELTSNTEITISITFDQIINETENNPYIGEDLRNEMLENIKNLQNISESTESNIQKWAKVSKILSWISNQGIDIGLKLLPLILKSFEQ